MTLINFDVINYLVVLINFVYKNNNVMVSFGEERLTAGQIFHICMLKKGFLSIFQFLRKPLMNITCNLKNI